MTKIDKNDLENINFLKKELKLKNIQSIKIKKGDYEVEIASSENVSNQRIQQIPSQNENSQKTYDEINTRLNDLQTQINSNNIDIANQTSLISKNTSSVNNNKSAIKQNVSDINNLKESVLIKTQTVQTTNVLTPGEIKSDFAKAHSNLGTILKDLGREKEANKHYSFALEKEPNNIYFNIN